jgi:hypothetical protein
MRTLAGADSQLQSAQRGAEHRGGVIKKQTPEKFPSPVS